MTKVWRLSVAGLVLRTSCHFIRKISNKRFYFLCGSFGELLVSHSHGIKGFF